MSKPGGKTKVEKTAAATESQSSTHTTGASGYRHKSICSFLHYFVGIQLSVELKGGRSYHGTLSTADQYMNLTLDEALYFRRGRQQDKLLKDQEHQERPETLTSVHIRGSSIRYVHFPDELDLTAVIRLGMDRERAAAQKYTRGKRS